MKHILEEIIQNKREEIKTLSPITQVIGSVIPFQKILENKQNISLIGEIKMKSPSNGDFTQQDPIETTKERAKIYQDAGVDAISIVTDAKYFGGSYDMIPTAREIIDIPILQKDFVIDPVQIHHAKSLGASALLLITRILEKEQLISFIDLCFEVGIEPVVEIYDEQDLTKVLETKARFIGVNARDLDTFEISIEKACALGKQIPSDKVFIGFSGVNSKQEVQLYKDAGAKAVLVGSALMKSGKPEELIKDLKS